MAEVRSPCQLALMRMAAALATIRPYLHLKALRKARFDLK